MSRNTKQLKIVIDRSVSGSGEARRLLFAESALAGVGQKTCQVNEGTREVGVASDHLDSLVNVTITRVTKTVSGDADLHVTRDLCH